ncbi:hypothetical protein [Lysobacter gummosus]
MRARKPKKRLKNPKPPTRAAAINGARRDHFSTGWLSRSTASTF